MKGRHRVQIVAAVVGLAALGWLLVGIIRQTATTRGALQTYARLIASANAQDLEQVRSLCTARYLTTHRLEPAAQGGIIGFPRQIHPNYQVWVEGDEVWLCQGNRVGLVVRFVRAGLDWKYDGVVGTLRSDGHVIPASPDESNAVDKN